MRARWEDLLHTEKSSSPLAHPDTLVHLVGWVMEEIFAELEKSSSPKGPADSRTFDSVRALCPCGRNPYLLTFLAGEQALLEGLIQCQAKRRVPSPEDRDRAVAELYSALRRIAAREVAAFCAICQYREDCNPAHHPKASRSHPAA